MTIPKSTEVDKAARNIQYTIEGIKLVVVIIGIYAGMSNVQSNMKEEIAVLREQVETSSSNLSELKGTHAVLQAQVNDHSIMMGKFEERLINIKDDTQQTLDLVREFTSTRR